MVREVWIKVDKRIWRLERQALFESDNKYEDVNNDLYILGDLDGIIETIQQFSNYRRRVKSLIYSDYNLECNKGKNANEDRNGSQYLKRIRCEFWIESSPGIEAKPIQAQLIYKATQANNSKKTKE